MINPPIIWVSSGILSVTGQTLNTLERFNVNKTLPFILGSLAFIAISCLASLPVFASSPSPKQSKLEEYTFVGPDKIEVKVKIGKFTVPENRKVKNSRKVELKYLVFPTTSKSPKSPIVYLAGGPGGSATGTAKGRRFPLFMKLREVSDVILFDQRGTGLSNSLVQCKLEIPDIKLPSSKQTYINSTIKNVKKCVKFWQSKNIDLGGYNTLESAQDLVELTHALGTEKINLWGISYGTHLAFATAKYHPEIVDQMVLASSEGLDQTVKLPSRVQGLINKVDTILKSDKMTQKKYPNLIRTIETVLDRLDKKPEIVQTQNFRTKELITVGLGKMDIQFLMSYVFLRDPEQLKKMPRIFKDMEQGKFEEAAAYVAYIKSFSTSMNPMSIAMDTASGISPTRWKKVKQQANTALVGRTTNLPVPDINAYVPIEDLGDDFRQQLKSDISTLFLAGTLDGRTIYESQLELAENFSNANVITVDGAGHNLFMSHPDITHRIVDFFSGKKVKSQTITLEQLVFE
ncbi:MAG: alpha/beta hydrolase [Kangiellaceae bacterium]|nr:alpha/beta hydrolase [Kangiellaceae bacterium]MCW9017963.1 alpha/beta hydrolase [Kangiellaceae bacterium]